MNKINDLILYIKNKNESIFDFAIRCSINPIRFDKIINSNNINFTKEEIDKIYKIGNNIEVSLNELYRLSSINICSNVYKRMEIYWVDFTGNQGSEQGNIRPAIITSNNKNNMYSPTINVAPITSISNNKNSIPTHVEIGIESGLSKKSIILLEQVRTIDKSRCKKYIGFCTNKAIKTEINKAIKIQMGIECKDNTFNDFITYFINKYKLVNNVKFKEVIQKEFATYF